MEEEGAKERQVKEKEMRLVSSFLLSFLLRLDEKQKEREVLLGRQTKGKRKAFKRKESWEWIIKLARIQFLSGISIKSKAIRQRREQSEKPNS